jgi:hypothetical protein
MAVVGERSASRNGRFNGTRRIGSSLGNRTCLEGMEKAQIYYLFQESNICSPVVQAVAQRAKWAVLILTQIEYLPK